MGKIIPRRAACMMCMVPEQNIDSSPFFLCHVNPLMSKSKPKTWWGVLFLDHPGLGEKHEDAYVESGTGNTKSKKVYCNNCMLVHTEQLRSEDQYSFNEGRIDFVRDDAAIQTHCESIDQLVHNLQMSSPTVSLVWSKPQLSIGPGGYLRYAHKTCLNHLKSCENHSADT